MFAAPVLGGEDVADETQRRLEALEQQNALLMRALEQGMLRPVGGEVPPLPSESYEATDQYNEGSLEAGASEAGSVYQMTTSQGGGDPFGGLAARIGSLESAWQKQLDDLAKKKADDAKKPTLKVSGRIHFDYWSFPDPSEGIGFLEHSSGSNFGMDPEDRFVFRRMRFGVAGDIPTNMFYKIEMEFAGGNNVEYRDAYLGFKELPYLQTVYIGNQKRPYGLDHINSTRYNVFLERPLVIEAFNQDSRRLGIASWGHTEDEYYNWRFGVYNLELTQNDSGYIGDNYQMEVAGRLAATPWYDEACGGRDYLHLAIAGSFASPDGNRRNGDTNNNEARFRTRVEGRLDSRWLDTLAIAGAEHYELLGLEAVYNVGAFSAVAEYQNVWLQRDPGSDLFFHGAYVYVAYFLTGEHQPWDRKTGQLDRVHPFENFFMVDRCSGCSGGGWGAWQIAARASYLNLTDKDIAGGDGEDYTLALNWLWNPYARLQFDYSYGQIKDHRPVGGFTGGHFHVIGARFGCDF